MNEDMRKNEADLEENVGAPAYYVHDVSTL